MRSAAGLLLVFPVAGRAHIVLTLRSDSLGRHGGQVSLPGGAVEPGETIAQAALREAEEEVALPAADARLLGLLTPLDIPVSGFRLHPVVAAMERRPGLTPAEGEVAAILEVGVEELLQQKRLVTIERERDGRRVVVPALRAGRFEVWGATAMVLAEFLVLLDWDYQLS
jgi:8-oxo-dGTP pyrophosphatase MutT (NUDIX family)